MRILHFPYLSRDEFGMLKLGCFLERMAFPLWIDWSHVSKIYEKPLEETGNYRNVDRNVGLLDFSASIRRGITVVLGPEGSGKTTLLKLTAMLMVPHDGSIAYQTNDGDQFIWSQRSVSNAEESGISKLKTLVGYVPLIRKVTNDITCEESLLYLARFRRVANARKRCAELIAQWGLAGWRKTPLEKLPPHLLKRYMLAQSLLARPKFWILDEPTWGLDELGRRLLIQELMTGSEERIVLLATQDMELAELADDLILLEYGSCRRIGKKKFLTASVSEGTVAAWYKTMQQFAHLHKPVI